MDSKELLNDKIKSDDFSYSFKIERHFFTILKIKENFELKVDNLPFIEIMEDERCGKLEKMRENLQKKQKENNLKDKQPKINKVKEDEFEYDDGDKKFENELKEEKEKEKTLIEENNNLNNTINQLKEEIYKLKITNKDYNNEIINLRNELKTAKERIKIEGKEKQKLYQKFEELSEKLNFYIEKAEKEREKAVKKNNEEDINKEIELKKNEIRNLELNNTILKHDNKKLRNTIK